MSELTPRERFIAALERRPIRGRVPHFELAFYLTMQAFGKVHPLHRDYSQWFQMEETERRLHRNDMADLYISIAERFEHNAIFVQPNPGNFEECARLTELIREKTGDRYFLMKHGNVNYGIPEGNTMEEFRYRMQDEPDKFAEFVLPYLTRLIQGYRELGFYTIKHTDRDMMPIIDQLIASGHHALHSLDPQGGVDMRWSSKSMAARCA